MSMKFFRYVLILVVFNVVHAQTPTLDLRKPLPVDSKITVGKLDNGLTYYIRENHRPEKRAQLRLVVNAGSILEDDDQQGLAHFTEHMAFNGTEHFAKHQIVDFLESIGMRFGADINAYTNFDETVFMLEVPTDSAEILEKAFTILEDWAHNISFDPNEIDKERGVVIEEWRLGRGASARIRDKQFPILFKNSRYAERLPIGKKDILENANRETFLRFYHDWYRPDLMAVIAVGDFDKARIEKLIKRRFASIKPPQHPRSRVFYPVPENDQTLFALATDKEATGSNVNIYYKHDVPEQGTVGDYRKSLIQILYSNMLNNRLNELLQKPKPPFLFGYSGDGRFIRTKNFYFIGASVADNGIERGLDAVLTEAERVKRFGFSQTELERQKKEFLRGMEQAFKERDKTESGSYVAEFTRNYLNDEPIPGIEFEYGMTKMLLPDIKLSEVNRLAQNLIQEKNRVILASAPEKEGVTMPSEKELLARFDKVEHAAITPYKDTVSDAPLVSTPPRPGRIVAEKSIDALGVTEWQLSNGAKVVLKPTDFKNDEVLFTAFSPGGHSLVSNRMFISAVAASPIIREGGIGKFNKIDLQKKLAGKLVNVSPWISALQEGLSGRATPQDLTTLFQLIYLEFTAPRKDSTAFLSFRSRINGFIQNRSASPEAAYQDTIQVIMSQHNFRARPWSKEVLNEMNLENAYQIYRDRFADASDFTFFFVGNFNVDEMKPLVATYLGGLPSINRHETWKDPGIHPPKGRIVRTVKRGLAPKSEVSLIFTGPFDWTRDNRFEFRTMVDVLRIKLREVLREDKGGTYGVGVRGSTSKFPREEYSVNISFGCAPERVDELVESVFIQIDSLKNFGTTDTYLNKVKEGALRKHETDLKENRYWLNALRTVYYYQSDPMDILTFDDEIQKQTLKDVQKAAKKYLNVKNYVKVVLVPEKDKS